MIAITGAAGKTGIAIVQALKERGAVVRALVHRADQQVAIKTAGATECIVGDMADTAALMRLLDGTHALYHICPNMHPNETEIGDTVWACARAAGVQHVVYHSVLHPQTAAMPHHWQKMLTEDALLASGLPFTILQPTAYMQNLLAYWRAVCETGRYVVPYPVATRLSLVDVRDVATVAARVLREPGHIGATYELVGTAPMSQTEVAALMAAHLGQPVNAEELPLATWEAQARTNGLPPYAVETLSKMFRYYAAHGLVGNANGLKWLLGRAPMSLDAFIEEIATQQSGRPA